MEQIFTDFTIHSIYEKQGDHILDIDKFKLAIKNSNKIKCTNLKITKLREDKDNKFDDALQCISYVSNHVLHLEKSNEMYSFLRLFFLTNNSSFITIDSLFYRFFKNLTLETMIEIRNLILETLKKKIAFEFTYDNVIFYVYYNKTTQIFGSRLEHTLYLKHIYTFLEKHNLIDQLSNLFRSMFHKKENNNE